MSLKFAIRVPWHKIVVLAFDGFHFWCLSPWFSSSHFIRFFLLDSITTIILVASESRTFAVKHDGFFDQIDDILKGVEALDIRFKQIRSENNILFVEGVSLEVAIELLKRWVLEISEIEVVNSEVVDE